MSSMKEKESKKLTLTVNGVSRELEVGSEPDQVAPSHTLAHTLREALGLTGTKVGCDRGACSSCTVLMEGDPLLSCMTLTVECNGRHITTIEGLQDKRTGKLDPLQEAFIDNTAFQCGFCTPGILMACKSLLNKNASPDEQDVKEALSGHYCRCISHYHVVEAVLNATKKGRE